MTPEKKKYPKEAKYGDKSSRTNSEDADQTAKSSLISIFTVCSTAKKFSPTTEYTDINLAA